MSVADELPVHRLSVEDVYRMSDAGILTAEDRVELLDGVLVDVTPPGYEHSALVARLTRLLVTAIGDAEVRVQDMMLVRGGFLSPDLIVVATPPPGEQPRTAELAVEVSKTSLRHDRRKAARYALADVDEYWIVDVESREVLVHRDPGPDGYETLDRRGRDDTLTLRNEPVVDLTQLFDGLG